jgi:hypothetical protein
MDRLGPSIKHDVLAPAIGKVTAPPRIVARTRDAKGAVEGGDRMQSLIGGYELEDSPGSE